MSIKTIGVCEHREGAAVQVAPQLLILVDKNTAKPQAV